MSEILDPARVDEALREGPWSREGAEIVLVRKCGNFAGSLAFVNAVGSIAEEADHHPDITISWDTVTLRVTTHSAGGLTVKDIDLARRIDAVDER